MAMPQYAVLQSCYTNKYMNYIQDDGPYKGYVSLTGDSVLSPYARVAFEKSRIEKGYYHVRCCRNNKYWVGSSSEGGSWVVAKAKEPNEDKLSNVNCTLFKVEMVSGDPEKIYMWHEGTGELVCVNQLSAQDPKSGLLSGVQAEVPHHFADACYFKWFDCDLLVVLPQHVAFKGPNGRYLQLMPIDGVPFLQFSATDPGDPSSWHEIIPNSDGTVRIKSKAADKYWRSAEEDWILADESEDSSDNTAFMPMKVGPKTVVFKLLGKENFCSKLTISGSALVDLLNANAPINSLIEAEMEIEELVLRRRIDNVHFQLDDARISEEKDVIVSTHEAIAYNYNHEEVITDLSISFTGNIRKTFSAPLSISTVDAEVTISADIPVIANGEIKLEAGDQPSFKWGTTLETSHGVEMTLQVKVPPKSSVRARMLATKGKAEIPFSYTRTDFLVDGTEDLAQMDDGIFTTTNYYNYRMEAMRPMKTDQ